MACERSPLSCLRTIALRSTSYTCYNRAMGMQGLCTDRMVQCAADNGRRLRLAVIMSSLMLPALAGCSSFSSPFAPFPSSSTASNAPPNPYQTAAAPPPNASPAPAGRPGYAPPPAPAPVAAAAAPPPSAPPPQQETTISSMRDSYVSFLETFRDHPKTATNAPTSAIPADDPRNTIYPNVSLMDIFTSESSRTPPDDPRNAVYPNVSLTDVFKSGSASTAPPPNVPHPPSTYTASGQPYSPAAGQTAAAAPAQPAPPVPPAQPAQPAQPSGTDTSPSVYPKQSLFDIFKRDPQGQ